MEEGDDSSADIYLRLLWTAKDWSCTTILNEVKYGLIHDNHSHQSESARIFPEN